MFNRCNTLVVSWNAPIWGGGKGDPAESKMKNQHVFLCLYAKYLPPFEHNPLTNNVSFIQTFTFEALISDIRCSENAAERRGVAEKAGSKMHF